MTTAAVIHAYRIAYAGTSRYAMTYVQYRDDDVQGQLLGCMDGKAKAAI